MVPCGPSTGVYWGLRSGFPPALAREDARDGRGHDSIWGIPDNFVKEVSSEHC